MPDVEFKVYKGKKRVTTGSLSFNDEFPMNCGYGVVGYFSISDKLSEKDMKYLCKELRRRLPEVLGMRKILVSAVVDGDTSYFTNKFIIYNNLQIGKKVDGNHGKHYSTILGEMNRSDTVRATPWRKTWKVELDFDIW